MKNESWEDFDCSDHSNDDNDTLTHKTAINKHKSNKRPKTIKPKTNKTKIIKKYKDVTANVKKQRLRRKNNINRTSRIASSLLEGEFTWNAGQWR